MNRVRRVHNEKYATIFRLSPALSLLERKPYYDQLTL